MRQRNIFVSGPKFTNFFLPNRGGVSVDHFSILILDISIRCRDIGGQTLKLFEIACTVDFALVGMRQHSFFINGQNFTKFSSFNGGWVVVDHLLFKFLTARFISEIFAVRVESCHKTH